MAHNILLLQLLVLVAVLCAVVSSLSLDDLDSSMIRLTKFNYHNITRGLSKLELQELTYSYSALEPFISERTMKIHHDKHHLKYITNAKSIIETEGSGYSIRIPLEDIMARAKAENNVPLFNNAAQSWNHAFYWHCLRPAGQKFSLDQEAPGLKKKIIDEFGSFDAFKAKFVAAVNAVFGSGWTWLVLDLRSQKLEIVNTANGENPLISFENPKTPILVVDVWEHAYYLDYQNVRANYATAVVDNILNWEYAEFRYQKFAFHQYTSTDL